ncbi:unnamed protein product, partial [Mesorhabditis belari]|uniref:Uncharacterized protein n=1 Tax=Mesorhabditis belari TaxID=2138241 RepID=A0AAF3FI49_9BILA
MPEFPRSIDERGAFDRSAAPDHFRDPDAGAFPITTQALPNSFDAEIRKKIVLNNVLDRSPNPISQSDRDDVRAILYAIGAEFLRQNIRGIQREGHFDPNGRPRPVVVIFSELVG